jgi:hypothetical protein
MVPLACELSAFEARLLAARLGADGVVWELRGCDSVYPVGWVDVLVSAADLEHAQELLLLDEIESVFDDDEDLADGPMDGVDRASSRPFNVVLAAVGILVVLSFLTIRIF